MKQVIALVNAVSTSIGTSTTKTQLNAGSNVTMPSWAKSIVAFVPYHTLVTMTAQEVYHSKLTVESDDVTMDPFEALLCPQHGGLGTTHDLHCPKPEKFIANIPLEGGEEIKLSGTALVANTVAPEMGCTIVVSNLPAGLKNRGQAGWLGRQRFGKVGTRTASGTTADTETAGTAYTIHGAERIVEVYGEVGKEGTMTASDPIHGFFRLSSSDFKVAAPLKYCVTPAPAGLGTIGTPSVGGLARFPVSIPVNQSCTIQDYFTNEYALAAAGSFTSALFFEKVGF